MSKETKKSSKAASGKVKHPEKHFLTVGIGASAGGIKALRDFFAAMPSDSGMAFVVILHLSETHKSSLAEILQRETKMQVEQVNGTVTVKPNNVYVIPPAKHLEMTDGVIKLKAPLHTKGVRVPIDRFFRTMALAYGRKAVCIILSGTGSDGTIGMKEVKDKGGFAMIQDPKEAEYDGMPRSAIDTKIADIVLPIAAMPEKLLFVRDTTEKFRLTDGDDGAIAEGIKNIDLLRDVLTLLRVRTGHDFSNYKRPTLIRRMVRHLQIYETDDLKEYLEILRKKPDEVLSLLKNLLINVTNFFRDKETFVVLEQKIIPALFEGKSSSDQVRVWIAGCSTGEEAYSIAILLSEYATALPDPPRIQIFASDVDEDAITEAREGSYSEAAIVDVSPERLHQFFTKEEDNNYRIRKGIREMILFAPHNILRDPPFSRLDLVSCRNVLIYLNRETQEQVLKVFHFALSEGGYLFLGSSETAESTPNHFSAIDKKHRLYQCRQSTAGWNVPPTLPLPGFWSPKLQHQETAGAHRSLQSFGELHHRLIEHYALPSVLVNEEGDILHLSENAGRFLRFAGGEPSANIMKVIHPALLSDLRAALFTARKENKTVEAKNIRINFNDDAPTNSATGSTGPATEKRVNIIVRAIGIPEASALIMFEEVPGEPPAEERDHEIVTGDKAMESVMRRMEDELKRTKGQLRNTIEQYETSTEELKASNEELQAINEELRSASEELETSKEELQSVNEELTTVNNELKEKVDETMRSNSDLQNLMHSTDIATIFLDRALHIKRYTPRATEIFNLIPTDVGRPLGHITHRLEPDNFQSDAARSLQSLQTSEHEVRAADGRSFIVRFSPYRTLDDKIEGVVISFINITERVKAEQRVRDERVYAETIIETLREPLIVLDKNLQIVSASRSFYQTFEVNPNETEGKYIFDLGNKQWDIPALHNLLENVLPNRTEFENFEVEHNFENVGRRIMLLNAREILSQGEERRLILLAIEDITARKKTEERQEFLLQLDDAIRSLNNASNIKATVQELIGESLKVDRAFFAEQINVENADYWLVEDFYARPEHPFAGGLFPVNDFRQISEEVLHGKISVVENVEDEQAMPDEEKKAYKAAGFAAHVAIPLVKEGKFIAFFALHSTTPRVWKKEEIELTKAAVERMWVAVESAKGKESLQESEKKYRELVTLLPVALYSCSEEGRILFFNEMAVKLWGYTPDLNDESLKFCACSKVWMMDGQPVPPEETPMAMALKTGQSFRNVEALVQRPDGKKFYASVNVDPLFDEQGNIKGAINIFQDITIIKEAEITIRKSKERLTIELADMRLLQNTSGRLIPEGDVSILYEHVLQAAVRLMQANAGSLQMYFPEKNELHLITSQGFDPESAKAWEWVGFESKSSCGQALHTGKRVIVPDIETSALKAGPEEQDYYRLSNIRAVQSTPLISRSGALIGMLSTHWHEVHEPTPHSLRMLDILARQVADLIDREHSEEALRRSEENYRAIINQTIVGVLKTDLDGEIVYTNEQFGKMLGYTTAELLQKNIADLVYENDKERHYARFNSIKKTDRGYVIEKRLVRKDGSYIWASNYNSPIFSDGNGVESVSIISVDISLQKAVEKQKDDFISIASHELKTPLTGIKGYAELLLEMLDERNEMAESALMTKLNEQVDRMTKLVHTLLDTSQITNGRLQMKPEAFDLNELIKEHTSNVALVANHRLILKTGDLEPVYGDRERIGQVLTNLINNAIKYSPDGGDIIITSERVNNAAKVSVRDFGTGISPDVMQKIFKRFYRGDGVNESISGFGLGLYISMEIIKKHHGEMAVESEPGNGALFYFKIPYSATADENPE